MSTFPFNSNILKDIVCNVEIKDEFGSNLLKEHNLFVKSGRTLIRDVFLNGELDANPFATTNYAIELGDDSTTPTESDTDILGPLATTQNVAEAATYPKATDGATGTGIEHQFVYANNTGGPIVFREIGLFYRSTQLNPYDPGGDPNNRDFAGILLARLKTTYSAITVGDGRAITINWKFIF